MVHHGHADKDVIRILENASEKKTALRASNSLATWKLHLLRKFQIFFQEIKVKFDSGGHLQSFKVQIAHHAPMAMASMASASMASVALLAGDAAARARAYVALSAGASLEEVEEARHLAEDVQTEQVTGRMAVGDLGIEVVN